MSLSTDSIIHYTNTLEKLKGIITEGFGIKYCAERLKAEGTKGSSAAHPMISFCDIPLSQSFNHVTAYGGYGIGLSKVWAGKMFVNPVLYLESNSSVTNTLAALLRDRRKKANNNLNEEQRANILRIKCFTKNYSGQLKRQGKTINNYRFYDEREWRLVPSKADLKNSPFAVDYTKYVKDKEKYNSKIADLRFNFSHEDISYVIVNQTIEIPEAIDALRKRFSNKVNQKEMDLLLSKICSAEQIKNDY